MAGFIQDPIQFINLIADNLRDRYQSGFPILKELVQNTDDSQATELHFGRSSGLPGADHILLRGPALFFVNNGRFGQSDAVGIRSFGQNSKAADTASIGKFGLGMKSVFHFCEAFFFLAHDGERSYAEVLNPWSGPESMQSLHRDWDDFSEADAQAMREHLTGVLEQSGVEPERAFILWLPLRRKAHLTLPDGDEAGAIVAEYPGDDPTLLNFLDEPDLPERLAALIPLLRHLQNAALWDLRGATGARTATFEVRLADGAQRLSLLQAKSEPPGTTEQAAHEHKMRGRIQVIKGKDQPYLGFSGLESHSWNPALEVMHRHELWPSSYVRVKGHSSQAKDKAQPHGCALFSRIPGHGRLITNWSVFLPLDEVKAIETVPCDDTADFRLTLHGYFFVDAGRQRVHGLETSDLQSPDVYDSEDSLRRAWNCELLRSNVLPLVLPALDAFCSDEQLADKSRTALSEALKNTAIFRDFRQAITARHSWFREITPESVRWVLRGAECPVLKLPDPPDKDTSRPWRLFPALDSISERCWLTVAGAPNLLNSTVDAQWQEVQLLGLLNSISAKTLFSEATLLDYLVSFLADSAGPFTRTQSFKGRLAHLLKQGLLEHGEEGLRRHETRIRRVVNYLDLPACFRIVNDLPRSLLEGLLSADTEALPLPARFFPPEAFGDAILAVTDAARFLVTVEKALAGATDSNTGLQNAALKLSEQLIKGVPAQHRSELLQRCAELRVLGGFDCKKDRRAPISVREIREVREAGTLFGSAEGTTERARLGLAADLQKVLCRERVVVINKDTASLALDIEGAVRSCDEHAVLRCLGLKPRVLGGLDERAALARLAHIPSGDEEVRGLRFLLHADPKHFHDKDTLWVLGRKQAPVWQKLWTQLVGGAEKPWNLLDGLVADALSRREWDAIDIHEISAQGVLDELKKRGMAAVDPTAFDREQCEQILSEARNRDDPFWRSLPFHWTRKGFPVSGAADNAYLDVGGIHVPDEMLSGVDLIQLSDDAELAQRQKRSLTSLDEQATIRIALVNAVVPDRWRVIMDALHALDRAEVTLHSALLTEIRSSRWLPVTAGAVAKPEDVIDLDAAQEEVDRVLALEPGAFVTPRTLASAIAEHPFFPKLQESFFARGKEGLVQLGAALESLEAYQIGSIQFNDAAALADTAQVLGDHANAGWQLLSTLINRMGPEDCFDALLSGMTGAVRIDYLADLLNWIASRGGDQSHLIRVFNRYLAVFAREQQETNVLGCLTLLNQESRWKSSSELVTGVTGVAPGYLLHDEQARILSARLFKNATATRSADAVPHDSSIRCVPSTGHLLRDYFGPWTGRVSPLSISALLILFGREETPKLLAKDLLGQHSAEWLIDQYPWNVPPRDRLAEFSLNQALEHTAITVSIHQKKSVLVHSILGKPIDVPLSEEFSTLFVGPLRCSGNNFTLALRRIELDKFSDQHLSQLVKQSIIYLLTEVYDQRFPNIDRLWEELDKSDQVDIDLAKALILENIPFYLKILGAHEYPALRDRLKRFRESARQEKEFGATARADGYRRKKEQELKALQNLIESDETAQRAILDSVQRKIKDFQYQPESVPFELFQNADDALRHLELIHHYTAKADDLDVQELPAAIRRFVISADTTTISFMHWGRAINQYGSQGFPGRERGFDRDLENMLILSASDKGEDVTGKFGLGFKSVWLVSDRPTLVSGRLQTLIVGGVLPVTNRGEITQRLVAELAARQPDRRWPGTAIHLPLLGDVSEDTVLDRFCNVAGAIVAFSRSLRSVEVQRSNGLRFSVSWEPRALRGVDGIQLGRVHHGDVNPLLAMKISLDEGALLLAVDATGFVELPNTVPSIWVTAPIREQERLGFAINAMFDVDAGRSRLSADVDRNRALGLRLGRQLAGILELLFRTVSERWQDVVERMELAGGVEPYDFWHSLWRTLVLRLPQLERESGSRVVATALLSEGLRDLAEAQEVIPNGLPNGFQRLIRSAGAKIVLKGALSDTTVLASVAKASCFRSLLQIDSAVSQDVGTWLRLLIPSFSQRTDRLQSINLTHLLSQLDRRRALSTDDANALGEALSSGTLEAWEKSREVVSPESIRDFQTAAEKAGDLSFLSASGSVERCKQLLTNRGSEDEKRRWAFAPDQARLAEQYRGEGAAFFLWCRDKLEAPADKLKEWIIQAADADRRKAALRYLLEGELAHQVVRALHETGVAGSWLAAVEEESDLLSDWDPGNRWRLVYQILKTPEESRTAFQYAGGGAEEQGPEPIEPEVALERIYEWWMQERGEHLERYRRATYPEGRHPNLKDDAAGKIDRSSWLLVLLLGGFHTMGRALPEQHRTFIENCQSRDWWTVFTDPNPVERFEDWMGVLDEYIDQQVDQQDYEQWMMRFPIIYKLSRNLDEYAELLLGLVRYQRRFDLAAVLRPWADPDQQGGGIGAAALPRTLGIGANFVIRELIRLGVIDSPHLREHAFVPYRGVCQLIAEMGCPEAEPTAPCRIISPAISAFLHEHMDAAKVSFCGDFDIPLKIVAKDWVLQLELLGRPLSLDDFG